MHIIRTEKNVARNTEVCFTTTIGKGDGIKIEIVAKDIYNAYVNGKFVCYGPSRAAKGYARQDALDISGYLTEEVNRVDIYVQANETKTLCFSDDEAYFGAEIKRGDETIKNSLDFDCYLMTDKLSGVERMSSQRGYVEVYRQKENRTPFTGGIKVGVEEIASPKIIGRNVKYAKNEIVRAEEYAAGKASDRAGGTWVNDFTKMLDSGKNLYSYTRRECDCVLSDELLSFDVGRDGKYYYRSYRFGNVECGKFRIYCEVPSAPDEANIWLVYDDILVDGKIKFNREQIIHGLKWTLKGGEYELYSQEVYSAKYITLIFDKPLKFKAAEMIRIENPSEIREWIFPQGKEKKVYEAAARSFRQNAYDILTDCPSRERSGWLCDSYFLAMAEHFFTGENVVERNFLENYRDYKNEVFDDDGILPMCYPSVITEKDDYIPNWILWFLLELKNREERTGDKDFTVGFKPRVKSILNFFEKYENEYGLLENLDGWVFIEWSKANDYVEGVNFPSNMLYASALEAAGEILGDEKLKGKSEKLKKEILRQSFDGKHFHDNAVRENGKLKITRNVSETCQNYALFTGTLKRAENEGFYQRFFGRFAGENLPPSNIFIGYVLRLFVLYREGRYRDVIGECVEQFYPMAEKTGTIWELFSENASCNHGFGSVIGMLLYKSYEKEGKK